MVNINSKFKSLHGKRILITGAYGFKGSWLSLLLTAVGADVYLFGHPPRGNNKLGRHLLHYYSKEKQLVGDLSDKSLPIFLDRVRPEIVFHLASRSLVSEAQMFPMEFSRSNIEGTSVFLRALANLQGGGREGEKGDVVVFVCTTDKVYEQSKVAHVEEDKLGGSEPYSLSKVGQEYVVKLARHEGKNIEIFVFRSGNVIGGGDSSQSRLIPSLFSAWESKSHLELRNPDSIRPWQHVLDVCNSYIEICLGLITETIPKFECINVGPSEDSTPLSAIQLIKLFQPEIEVPITGVASKINEDKVLLLNSNLLRKQFLIKSRITLEESVKLIIEWELSVNKNTDPVGITLGQIHNFLKEVAEFG